MQGRLSQKDNSPLQSFPFLTWKDEILRAREIGFNRLEWLIDKENDYQNPLFSSLGRSEIIRISKKNKINIDTLCAHFLINGELLKNSSKALSIRNYFFETLKFACLIGIKYVSIPLMDKMSLEKDYIRKEIELLFRETIDKFNLTILIESDLASKDILSFIRKLDSKQVGVLYDTGNATRKNLSFKDDFPLISDLVKEIHFKDYSFSLQKSVRLGYGDTNFAEIYKTLKSCKWLGPIVLETPIFKSWEIEAKNNLNFSKLSLEKFYQ